MELNRPALGYCHRGEPMEIGMTLALLAGARQGTKPAASRPTLPFDLRQPYRSSSKRASCNVGGTWEPSRMQYGGFRRPADDDHGWCFVRFNELDGDGVVSWPSARVVTLDIGIPALAFAQGVKSLGES
jgi:hypothetical protein